MPTDLEWLNKIASNMYLKNEFSTKEKFYFSGNNY